VEAVEEPSASSLAKGPPASTTTCTIRELDGTWVDEAPLPAWARPGEGQ
jgi:hypothetical protein